MSSGRQARRPLRVPVEDVPRRSLAQLAEEGEGTSGSSPPGRSSSGPPSRSAGELTAGSSAPPSRPASGAGTPPPSRPGSPPPPPKGPTEPAPAPPASSAPPYVEARAAAAAGDDDEDDAILDDPRPSETVGSGPMPPPRPSPSSPGPAADPEPAEPHAASGTADHSTLRSAALDPDRSKALPSGEDGLELEELATPTSVLPSLRPTPPPVPASMPAPPPPPAVGGPAAAEDAGPPPPPSAPGATAGRSPPSTPAPPTKPRKRRARPWFEDFFNDDYIRTVPPPRRDHIARDIDFIEASLGLERGATILDVGCGIGLHAVELAARGYLVVGLDLSLAMLSRAADEAQERGVKINFLHGDMREMSFEGAFDAVLCWGTTFGYFDDESNRRVVERLYAALKPMGLLLLDVVNRDFVIGRQPNLVWFEGDGCVCMEETQFNYITSRLEVKRTVILDDGRQRETPYGIRLYALHELGQLLHQKGFRVAQVSGTKATPGVFFGSDSSRMLILAERRLAGGAPPPTPPEEALTGTTKAVPPPASGPDGPAGGSGSGD